MCVPRLENFDSDLYVGTRKVSLVPLNMWCYDIILHFLYIIKGTPGLIDTPELSCVFNSNIGQFLN